MLRPLRILRMYHDPLVGIAHLRGPSVANPAPPRDRDFPLEYRLAVTTYGHVACGKPSSLSRIKSPAPSSHCFR